MTAPPRTDPRTALGLALLVVLLFRPWAAGGSPLFGSDLTLFFYPILSAIRDALTAGHFPWWTERVFAGMPLAADPQASLFYPPAWLLFSGPFERLMAPYLALHLLALGLGASVAFARLGASRLGAFLGGAALMLGTTVPARLAAGHLTYLQAAAWIPWAFAALLGFLATGERRRLATTGAFLGLSLLGGFPQIAFYGILWLLWTALAAPRPAVSLPRALGGTLLALLLAFGVAGAIVVPGWELSRLSVRLAGMSDAFRLSDSLPFRHLATFLLPGVFGGTPATYVAGAPYRWWEFTAYNGLLPWLALPLLGSTLTRHRSFLLLALPIPVTILLALGGNTPLYPLVMHLPGFSLFRIPAQILFLTAMALAGVTALAVTLLSSGGRLSRGRACIPLGAGIMLAVGWGLVRLRPDPLGIRLLPEAFASGALLCLLLTGAILLLSTVSRRVGTGILAAVLLADLLLPALPTVTYQPLARFLRFGEVAGAARPLGEPYRLLPLAPSLPGIPTFWPNEPLVNGAEGITGYNPLLPAGTARLLTAMTGGKWPSPEIVFAPPRTPLPPVTDLLNCRVIATADPSRLAGDGYRLLPWKAADPRWRFLLNDAALGRATIYPTVTRVPDRELDRRIRSMDPQRDLLVDARLDLPDVATDRPVRPALFLPRDPGAATILDREGTGGYLLVSQTWHPGWTAQWSGGPLPVLPADIGLTLVPLPPGCRRVELNYRPASHRAGLALSAASLLLLGLLAFGGRKRRP
jgi:hypothetical protein